MLRYSAQQQPRGGGQIPYGTRSLVPRRPTCGTSNDLDLWLLLAAAEYGLGTRDLAVLRPSGCPSADGGAASLWRHLKLAYAHQESLRGPARRLPDRRHRRLVRLLRRSSSR